MSPMAYRLRRVETGWGLQEELSKVGARPLKRWTGLYPKDYCLTEEVQICRARGNLGLPTLSSFGSPPVVVSLVVVAVLLRQERSTL